MKNSKKHVGSLSKSKTEYSEGYHTGKQEGYNKGVEDALVVIMSLMESNNLNLDPKEFWIEYNNLVEEGELKL